MKTALTDLLGIEVPIVQTGMGWVSTPTLTAATSNAGGLGILAGATMTLDELRVAIATTKSLTAKPFGVNLRADQPGVEAALDSLIEHGVAVASFAMAPKKKLIERLRGGGVKVIPSIGAKRHAQKVVEMGVDAVLVQGGEGGGHTGPIPTTLLLPQVVDAVDVPVIAAGGFFDGRGLVVALAYGAAGIAMGTRFLLTEECEVPDAVKQLYLSKGLTDTVVTTKVDGVPHRVLRTPFVERLERGGPATDAMRAIQNALKFKGMTKTSLAEMAREGVAMRKTREMSWNQVVMAANTPMLLRKAMVEGDAGYGVMASGQVVGMIEDLPTVAELIARIMTDAQAVLARLKSIE